MLSLYEESFPECERRNNTQLSNIANCDKRFYIIAAIVGNNFAGFLSFWDFNDFIYVEHLAVCKNMRMKGIGSNLIKHLMSLYPKLNVVLEVEPDTDDTSHKRIKFYQKLGFHLFSTYPYLQPPYSPELQPVKLHIMASQPVSTTELDSFTKTITNEVYYNYYNPI